MAAKKRTSSKPNAFFKAAHKGRRIAKGKTASAKGVRPSFMSKKEAEEFQRLRRNYNQRVARRMKALRARYPDIDLEEAARAGAVPYKMQKRLGDLEDRRQYLALKKMMKHTTTKTFRAARLRDMRSRLLTVIANAYGPGAEEMEEAERLVKAMDEEDILDLYFAEKEAITDVYNAYKDAMEAGVIDAQLYEEKLAELMDLLRHYAGRHE